MVSISRGLLAGILLAVSPGFAAAPASAAPAPRLALTSDRMMLLRQINDHVNATIVEVSDMEHYGRENVWKVPTDGKGDCKGISLLKRKLLIERGFPASALSIWVGATSQGEAHAVLAVATDRGPYVLDNLTSAILPASETGHVFYSRQSGRSWISAAGERTSEPTVDLPVARRVPPVRTASGGRT